MWSAHMLLRLIPIGAMLALVGWAGLVHAADGALKLEEGQVLRLTCSTDALVFRTDLFKPSRGDFELQLELKAPTEGSADVIGIWRPTAAPKEHAAFLATLQVEACSLGCPLSMPAGKPYELWALACDLGSAGLLVEMKG